MRMTIDELERIASTAFLNLTDEEKAEHLDKINVFLAKIESLEQVDTNYLEPLSHVQSLKNVFRKDELKASLPQEKVLKNALSQEEGMFKVPKII